VSCRVCGPARLDDRELSRRIRKSRNYRHRVLGNARSAVVAAIERAPVLAEPRKDAASSAQRAAPLVQAASHRYRSHRKIGLSTARVHRSLLRGRLSARARSAVITFTRLLGAQRSSVVIFSSSSLPLRLFSRAIAVVIAISAVHLVFVLVLIVYFVYFVNLALASRSPRHRVIVHNP